MMGSVKKVLKQLLYIFILTEICDWYFKLHVYVYCLILSPNSVRKFIFLTVKEIPGQQQNKSFCILGYWGKKDLCADQKEQHSYCPTNFIVYLII